MVKPKNIRHQAPISMINAVDVSSVSAPQSSVETVFELFVSSGYASLGLCDVKHPAKILRDTGLAQFFVLKSI